MVPSVTYVMDSFLYLYLPQTKDERDRVRLEVVEMEVQCVTITFRDGNTTDSNLLQVITSEEQQSHYEELLSQPGRPWDESNKGGSGSLNVEDVFEPLTLESTGASLSISAFDTNKNCTGQFIYFIAYYSTLKSTNSSLAQLGKLESVSLHQLYCSSVQSKNIPASV